MIIALFVLLPCIFFMLLGIFTGKNLPEKLMSLSCTTNYVIILLCILSLDEGRDSFIDIAYIYAFFSFIVNIAMAKLKRGNHDRDL